MMPRCAMVLAAGLGQRMRPITDATPKPLVRLLGRSMLDRALDRLEAAGVPRAVVNVHHLAGQIEARLAERRAEGRGPDTVISDERAALLETGGGIVRALPLLGEAPFLLLNSDSVWCEEGVANLAALAAGWDSARMDMRLMLAPRERCHGYDGAGDFHMDGEGRLVRRRGDAAGAHVYVGVAVLSPSAFVDVPAGAFSLNLLFDRAIAAGRLHGHVMTGDWLHVGTPDAIAMAEARLAAGRDR
jgi:MurNAc alpha-1-phosphate uridylyltransferase